jgi:hypothetical protein
MSSHRHPDCVSANSADPGTADIAVVRRADGRTLRKSCDRCHKQKLRCVADKASSTRCKRCQRAGLECVYGARSNKKARQCSINDFASWDNWPGNPTTPTSNNLVGELDTIFGLDLTHFDDVFPLPSTRPATGRGTAPNLPAPEHDAGIPVSSEISIPLLSSGSSLDAGHGSIQEVPELSAGLAKSFQELEATFLRTVKDQAGRGAQDCMTSISSLEMIAALTPVSDPIGEVLSALSSFLGVLKLNNVARAGPSCTPQSPHDAHLRSKQASLAAQGYVLCVRLLASLLDQMLQSLLASPSPTATSSSAAPDSTQDTRSLGALGSNFSEASHVPRSLRLGDLLVPPDHFGHALHSSVSLLRIGCSRLNEMEHLLGIPSKRRGQGTSSPVCLEQVGLAQQALPDNESSGPSLPARFVASIWEDEASISSKSSVVHLQRCRAAILGLTEHCA